MIYWEVSLLKYQMTTNRAVNRNIGRVSNNNSSKCLRTNKITNIFA